MPAAITGHDAGKDQTARLIEDAGADARIEIVGRFILRKRVMRSDGDFSRQVEVREQSRIDEGDDIGHTILLKR